MTVTTNDLIMLLHQNETPQDMMKALKALPSEERDQHDQLLIEATILSPKSYAHRTVRSLLHLCPHWINKADESGLTALMASARQGRLEMFDHLVELGADIYQKDKEGLDALMHSIVYSDHHSIEEAVVKTVLGAFLQKNPYPKDELNRILFAAADNGNLGAVRALLSAGARPFLDISGNKNILVVASEKNTPQGNSILSLLLKTPEGVSIINQGGKTDSSPLHAAVQRKNLDAVDILLHAGANPNPPSDINQKILTPLMVAAYTGNAPVMKKLLEFGATAHATDKVGNNALHYVAMRPVNQSREVKETEGEFLSWTSRAAKTLLEVGLSASSVNAAGQTPAAIAKENNRGYLEAFLTKEELKDSLSALQGKTKKKSQL